MGQALYRKYRSKKLSEIIGQEHITETLEKALKTGNISHAYLFTGPRGVGKTSIARILAHEINQIPYTDDSMHIDIIEIDAASNRRIDEIRDLREKVSVAPTSAKYKVYIIDEVHMLTKEAFNALLKTLEEPPAHVIFILATTDAHKLPETIVSRTQRYTFKPVEQSQVVDHLRQIASQEKIKIADEALVLLAQHGEGSFRDSISMLDQASSHGEAVELAAVQILLGIPPETGIANLIDSLATNDVQTVARQLNDLSEQGFQATAIAKVLSQTLRRQLLADSSPLSGDRLLNLLGRLLEVSASHDPERLLEIVLLDSAGVGQQKAGIAVAKVIKPSVEQKAPAKKTTGPVQEPVALEPQASEAEIATPANKTEPIKEKTESPMDMTLWSEVLDSLKRKYNTLYGVVRMATPTFDGNDMELAFAFAFHQKRLTDPKNKKILADIMYELSGQAMHITCVVKKDSTAVTATPKSAKSPDDPADLNAISSIFGGGEIIR